jgi:DNA-nicking Smr family endonuclease
VAKKILSDDDSTLFRQAVGKVKTIENDKVLLNPKPTQVLKNKRQQVLQVQAPVAGEQLKAEDRLSFLSTGLKKDVLKKLRRGYFGLDAELDLHGLTSDEAKRQLQRFLHDCIEEGCQCVHIIHGKGYRSKNSYPVLKNNLNDWLRRHNDVLAFCSASSKDGGTGAVLVLLHLTDKYQ